MKIIYLALCFLLFESTVLAQVGIGTTTPSDASMLEISSTSDGINYGGFLPPRVPSQTQRDLINVSTSDIGMLVFVTATGNYEIWNGISWETIYSLSTTITVLVSQDFDTNISWGYSNNPSFYAVGNDIFDITTNLGSGDTSVIDNVSGNFAAFRDLNNTNGGGNFDHELIFNNVDISSLTNPRIAFKWDVFEFDGGDDLTYQVFHDDVGQGIVNLFNGSNIGTGTSGQGTETIAIPASVTNVRITVAINQNGNDDYAAIDNFVIYGD